MRARQGSMESKMDESWVDWGFRREAMQRQRKGGGNITSRMFEKSKENIVA